MKNLKKINENHLNKINNLKNENFELNSALNVKKLQMQIKSLNVSDDEKNYFNLTEALKKFHTITELNIENSNLKNANQELQSQIKILNETISNLKDKNTKIEKTLNEVNLNLEQKKKIMNSLKTTKKKLNYCTTK